MRSLRIVVMLCLALTSLGGLQPASAGCGGPALEFHPRRSGTGDTLTVRGEGWTVCEEGAPRSGCSSTGGDPLTDITVELKGPRTNETADDIEDGDFGRTRLTLELGSLDEADEEGNFEIEVVVPEVPPGEYFVTARYEDSQPFPALHTLKIE